MDKGYADNDPTARGNLSYEHADAINTAIRLIGIRHRALAAGVLAHLGLHPGQEVLLMDLATHGPRTQVQLAGGIGCEPPSVTGMVRKLEAAGFVGREQKPGDARAVVVSLTPAGHDLMCRLRAAWHELARQTVAGFDALPADQLAAVLTALAGSLGVARHGCDGHGLSPSPPPS